ncbi:hemagglutinin repeat-containing protein [Zoogloea dura]|uniref:Filamentous hemagglutinin N-terminal domain-containing protein n=1 Tax=Zoogloea dura TaxID=2728840 RepID=A0A848G216_9RHOO|nr:hemagglutinin repeat-containing protein [Zoogloea dura]NML25120.1 filamentous hemagglutinin N-terminal domain-containing protein [Zoogloea dura]
MHPADLATDLPSCSRWRRLTARILLVVFGSGCILPGGAYGAPIADPNGPIAFRPGVGQTSTGVPAIDITRPNAAGTSYNRFQRFDVEAEGAVLNNSTRGGTTFLGGSVEANPNLAGGAPASVIVNEVVAPGATSRLAGTLEVFGAPATVIVANPHGVSCAGCGTLNSPRFMLSTGTPVWLGAGGSPVPLAEASGLAFDVAGGELSIEGRGLEGTVGKVDLIAVGIHLDGPVRAHYLNPELAGISLLAGAGRVAEQDGQFDNIAPVQAGPAAARAYAIDGTAFGAMSSSQIRIVSTEQGAGVRLAGPLLADSRGLLARSAGDLSLGDLHAQQSITLDAAGNLSLQGATEAGGDLSARAGGQLALQGPARVSGDANLVAGDTLDVAAPLAAGGSLSLDADRVRLTAGVAATDTQIRARELSLGDGRGDFQVQGNLALAVSGDLVAPGAVTVTGNTRLVAGASVGFGGDVNVGGKLSVDAGSDILAGGRISVGGGASLQAGGSVDISGAVTAGALDLAAGRAVFGGDVAVLGDASIVAGSVALPRKVEAGGDLRIETAGDLLSEGRVVANGDLNLVAGGRMALAESGAGGRVGLEARGGALSLGSTLVAGSDAALSARDGITTAAVSAGGKLALTSRQGGVVSGELQAGGDVSITAARDIQITGLLLGGGDVSLQAAQALKLDSDVSAGGGVRLAGARVSARDVVAAGRLDVSGGSVSMRNVGAGDALTVQARTGVDIGGDLLANGPLNVTVSDGALSVGGALGSNAALDADARDGIVVAGAVKAGGPVSLASGQGGIDIGGPLAGAGSVTAVAPGMIRFGGGTGLAGDLEVRSTAGPIRFDGALAVGGAATLSGARGLVLGGDAFFYGPLTLGSSDGLIAHYGLLHANTDFVLDTAGVFVSEGRLESLGRVSIRADRLVFDESRAGGVFANGDISLAARESVRLGALGAIVGGAGVRIDSPRFETDGAVLATGGTLGFSGGTLANTGLLAGQTLRVDGRLTNEATGQVSAGGVEVLGATVNRGGIEGASIVLSGGLDNAGSVIGDRVELGGDLVNSGSLGGGVLRIDGGRVSNTGLVAADSAVIHGASLANSGVLYGGSLDLDLSGGVSNHGVIESAGLLRLNAASVENLGSLRAGGSASLQLVQGLFNDQGTLSATDGLTIVSGASVINRGGLIVAGGDLGVSSARDLDSDGLVAANGRLRLEAGRTLKLARGGAGKDATLIAREGSVGVGSEFVAGGDAVLDGRDGVSTQALAAGGSLVIRSARGGVSSATLVANDPIRVEAAAAVSLAGPVVSDGDVSLSGRGITVSGNLVSAGRLSVDAGSDALLLSAEARADGDIFLSGGQISAAGVQSASRVSVQAGSAGLENTGKLIGNRAVDVVSGGGVSQEGVLASLGKVTLVAGQDVRLLGDVASGDSLDVRTGGNLVAEGAWRAAGTVDVRAAASLTAARDVMAGGAISLASEKGALLIGGTVVSNDAVTLKSGADLSVGGLQGGLNNAAAVSVDAAGDITAGQVRAGGDYRVRGGRDYQVAGETVVVGQLDLAAGRDVVQAGAVSVGGDALVRAGGALTQGDTRVFGAAALSSGGSQRYTGELVAGGGLALQAGAGVEVAGSVLSPARVGIEAGTGALTIAGDLRSGGALKVAADRLVGVGGETLAVGDAQLVSRQADVRLAGPVTAVGALSLAAAGDVRLASDVLVGGALDARASTGSVVFAEALEAGGAASFAAGQDLVFLGNTRFHGPLSANSVGRSLESRGSLLVDGDLRLDIAGDFVSEGLLQSVGGIRIRARNIQANQTGSGGMVANGDIELSAREQGSIGAGGSVLSSGGSVLLSANRFENAGDVIPGGARFVFSGGSLANLGRITAGQVDIAGSLDNRGTLYSDAVAVSGYTTNSGTLAGSTLAFDGGLLNTGRIAGVDVAASGLISNTGEITGDRVRLLGPDVYNYGVVSAGHLGIETVQLGNLGTLSAGSLDAYAAGVFTNSGRVVVEGDARITAVGGFVNQVTESSRCVTPEVCTPSSGTPPPRAPDPDKDFRFVQSPAVLAVGGSLSLSGGEVDNQGVIQARRIDINLGNAALSNTRSENDVLTEGNFGSTTPTINTGVIAAEDGITITAGSFANTGGRLATGGDLNVNVTGRLTSVAGEREGLAPVMQARDVTLRGAEVVTEGLVQARRELTVNARTGSVTNRATLVADDSLTVKAATTLDNSTGGALLATRSVSLQAGNGIQNAGLIYGNGAAAERISIDAGSGAFSNAASGTVLAGSTLEIKATSYSNSGTVASRGDARLDTPSLVLQPARNPLVALGTLRLDVAGLEVGVGEVWVSPAVNTVWSGVLVNTGNVLLGGNAYGVVDNLATGNRTVAGEPNLSNGSYLLLGMPTLGGAYLESHSDVGQRASFVVNGYFEGSLRNQASDAKVAGRFDYTAENLPQTLLWANASGQTEATDALSLARLDATGGPTAITLRSPEAGTIKADALSLSGVDLTIVAGVDSSADQAALAAARDNRVPALMMAGVRGLVAGLGLAPQGDPGIHIMTPSTTAGSGAAVVAPGRPLQVTAESITRSMLSGAGLADLSRTAIAAREAPSDETGVLVPAQPGNSASPQAWVNVDPAAPQVPAGGGTSSPTPDPTPGQTLPATEAARYGLAFPDWGSFSTPAGGLAANNLELVLSGNLTNRGVLEVSDQLLIKSEGRIDNFGAAIKAGGALGLFGASLDNRNGRIEAASLALSVDGELNNIRGQILVDKDAAIYAGGDLINDSGRIEAGSLAVSVAGDLFNRTLYAVDQKDTTTRSHTDYDSFFGATTTTDSDTTVVQRADQRAGIQARDGDLDLNVGKNLTSTGADLSASGDLTGRVGGKIDIQALSIENSRTQTHTVANERTYTYNNGETEITGLTASGSQVSTQIERDIQHQDARLQAGGKLDLESGGSTFILGADLKSGGETRIVAGGHLVVGSVQNSTHTESRKVTQTDGAAFLPGLVTRSGEQLKLTHRDSATGGVLESGGVLAMEAQGNISVSGGKLTGAHGVDIRSAQEISLDTLQSRTLEQQQVGRSALVRDASNNQGVEIDAGDGELVIAGGGDVKLVGANLKTQGRAVLLGSNVSIAAATDSMATLTEEHRKRYDHKKLTYDETLSGATLSAEQGVIIAAFGDKEDQGDILLKGAVVNGGQGQTSLSAKRDVLVGSEHTEHNNFEETYTAKSGFLSSKSTHTKEQGQSSLAQGSAVLGDTVVLDAGRDISIIGSGMNELKDDQGNVLVANSGVVSLNGTVLQAKGDVSILADAHDASGSSSRQTRKSGLFAGGGKLTLGSSEVSSIKSQSSTQAVGSTIASLQGSVTISAGGAYNQVGSEVLAPVGDVNVNAKRIDVVEARELEATQFELRMRQSGISLGVSSPVIEAARTTQQMSQVISRTDDSRTQALAGAAALLSSYSAYGTVSAGQSRANAGLADQVGGVQINISLGTSRSQVTQSQKSDSASSARVAAGGNVSLIATGGAADSDITVRSSEVSAGQVLRIKADDQISLGAAADTQEDRGSSKSSSASVGVGISWGGAQNGISFQASASQAKGNSEGSSTRYINTHVRGGQEVELDSGGNTVLKGAVVEAPRIVGNVAGDLSVESLQDSASYSSQNSSAGIGVSVCVPPICAGASTASVSLSKSQVTSNYVNVGEQSAIKAGDDGFQIHVGGNTDLKGGAIVSTEKAVLDEKNVLVSGTITTGDLSNHSSVEASSSGITLSSDMFTQGKYGLSKGLVINGLNQASEDRASEGATRAVVSEAQITISDSAGQRALSGKSVEQTVSELNRDTGASQQSVPMYDGRRVLTEVEDRRVAQQAAIKQFTTFTDDAYRVMFKEQPRFYKVTCPAGENCTAKPEMVKAELIVGKPEEVQAELAKASPGSVLAVNGILNPLDRASQLAMQNAAPVNGQKPSEVYLMHYVPANTALGELMIAGYEKTLAPVAGYTNQDYAYAEGLRVFGGNVRSGNGSSSGGAVSLGHSRGTIVQMNANAILADQGVTIPSLSMQGVGGAVSAEAYTQSAQKVVGTGNVENIRYAYFKNDPVSVVAGGNPGVLSLSEFWNVLTTSNSAHSCYGTGAAGCQQVQYLTPDAPKGASQNSSSLIQYIGGVTYDGDMNPIKVAD